MNRILLALAIGGAALPAPAHAQVAPTVNQSISGTRLDVNATGESMRVPDIAVISAGVVTRAATAGAAMRQNAERMERVIAALKGAGVADRDIQTSNLSLNPEYRYVENQPPQLTGYTASNQVNIRFRDIRNSGQVLDVLVAQGANQINGPTLTLDRPEAALDEARANAIAIGRARAQLYARSLGMQVVRIVSVSETGRHFAPPPPMAERSDMAMSVSKTQIVPGEQSYQVALAMVFELR
ncbi:MAG TPA: SIMPL domain-containing protein [Sphingomicrobium sp.]|nr:SIMPL domain-containing protein [Sphingomicrobium sp.]